MFRNLFLLIAIGLIIWIIQGFIRRSKPKHQAKINTQKMVQCQQCKTYLSVDEAILSKKDYFCCPQHLSDWTNKP